MKHLCGCLSRTAVVLLLALSVIRAQAGDQEPGTNAAPVNHLNKDGLPQEWLILGPFPNPEVESPDAPDGARRGGFHKDYLADLGGEAKAVIGGKTTVRYRDETGEEKTAEAHSIRADDGIVDFEKGFSAMDRKVAYAYSCIESPTNQTIHFFLGSDDSPKVWINGKLVHALWLERGRGMRKGDDYFTAELHQGLNPVLVKVEDDRGGWQFVLEAFDDQALAALRPERQLIRTRTIRHEISQTVRAGCELVLPTAYDDEPRKKWPLVVFLDYDGGWPSTVGKVPFPFIVLLPKCPLFEGWSLDALDDLLAEAIATYRIDPKRIYLTGPDSGGVAAWAWAMNSPDWFAAVAPICAEGDSGNASRLKDVPIWMIHVAGQDGQPVEAARNMLNALKDCGADVKLTTYPEAGVDPWTRTYNDPALYEWFLQHKRSVSRQPAVRRPKLVRWDAEAQGPREGAHRIIHCDPTGNDYEIVPVEDGITWGEARRRAEAMTHLGVRGHLATITSQAESDFLLANYGRGPSSLFGYWLGGFQPPGSPEPAGNWRWVTGEPWDFANWSSGEPNNNYAGEFGGYKGGRENALHLLGSIGAWNDVESTSYQPGFIVEYSTNLPRVGKTESAEPATPAGERKQLCIETKVTKSVGCAYGVSLPADYHRDPDRRWPVVVFLNYRGTWSSTIGKENSPFPFIVVLPVCPLFESWSFDLLDAVLDEVIRDDRGDADRVYVTGASAGGGATWEWAFKSPDRFAAIAPLCGAGPVQKACLIKDTPAWVFHGAKDFLPVYLSEMMVDALRECGADVKFTVYPEAGHGIWDQTYNNPELYEWFLTHSRSDHDRPAAR
jgi:poly(3-hydroxybutyrate) depolymerase